MKTLKLISMVGTPLMFPQLLIIILPLFFLIIVSAKSEKIKY
jgi:hypothetical protein